MVKVYLIASPIGSNLGDISINAVKILKKSSHILVENEKSNYVERLLQKNIIKNDAAIVPIPYKEEEIFGYVDKLLDQDQEFAILANEGLPCFLDPGRRIIRHVKKDKRTTLIPVGLNSALQGPFLLTGIRFSRFTFLGHYPEKKPSEKTILPAIMYVKRGYLLKFLESCEIFKSQLMLTILANINKPNYWQKEFKISEIPEMISPIKKITSPKDSFVIVVSDDDDEY